MLTSFGENANCTAVPAKIRATIRQEVNGLHVNWRIKNHCVMCPRDADGVIAKRVGPWRK